MNAKYLRMLAVHGDTWCLDAARLPEYMYDADDDRRLQRRMPKMEGRVAVIPVHGVLTKRGGWGVESTDRILGVIEAAVQHKGVSGILLDIDSPGGSSYGLQEFGDSIYSLRQAKPIVAIANPLAASAAYWTAAAAERVAVTPSGDIGHVGVWSLHMDYSGALTEAGIKATFIYAGEHKIDGNPFEPLSEGARAEMQASVNASYEAFVGSIAKHRGISRVKAKEMGDGRVHGAKRALELGFVDRVGTVHDVLKSMGATSADGPSMKAARDAGEMLLSVWDGGRADGTQQEYIDAHRAERERKRRTASAWDGVRLTRSGLLKLSKECDSK